MRGSYLKTVVALVALVVTFAAQADGLHAFVEPSGPLSEPYLWTDVTDWKICKDYPNDVISYRGNISPLKVPGDGKILHVDSNYLTPETPLKIDDGRSVSVVQAYIGTFAGAPYGDDPHVAALELGKGAVLVTANLDRDFIIGDREGAMGALILDSGSIVSNNKFRVGAAGFGVVTNNGGYVWTAKNNNSYGIYIGYGATGAGHYVQNAGHSDFRITEIGTEGRGTLEFCGGGANVGMPTLGVKSGGRGTYIVHSGAAVTNGNANVGSAENSSGTIDLRGGTFLCTGAISVRCTASAYGSIRGYGMLYKPNATPGLGEMNSFTMNGQVVADAQGVEGRVLDFSYARGGNGGKNNVKTTIVNGMDGTNGWYAVNKGVVTFPLLRVDATQYVGTFGDNVNNECDFVNTVRFSYNQKSNKGPWLEAQLYANDSAKIPDGLCGKVLGVFGFRSNASVDNRASQLANFTDFGLRIRYDHRNLKAGDTVALIRYDVMAEKWVRLARVTHDVSSPYIAADGMVADGANYDRNLGVFAVVKEPKGLLLIIK